MRRGADVREPPRTHVSLLEQRIPGFWRAFARTLDQAVGAEDVTLTSWWRSPSRNAEAGGVAHSQHLLGTGLDVDGPAPAISRIKQRAQRLGLVALGPYGDGHLHLQAFRAGQLEAAGIFKAAGLG